MTSGRSHYSRLPVGRQTKLSLVLLNISFDYWFSLECGRNVGETCFLLFKTLISMMFMLRAVRLD